jgi:hypothetical protein
VSDEQKALVERLRGHSKIMERDKGKFVRFIDVATCNEAADLIDAQAAEIARLRAGIAEVKARGVAMQNDAYTDADEMHGWGWECAGEWLEAFAQETQP